jgi:hypothetical protein
MAIAEFCHGLTVTIEVDGQPLKEYDIPDQPPQPLRTVKKYVETRGNTEFCVNVCFPWDYEHASFDGLVDMFLDETRVETKLFERMEFEAPMKFTFHSAIDEDDEDQAERPFRFRDIIQCQLYDVSILVSQFTDNVHQRTLNL